MIAETICFAVSAAGLGIALVTAYRRRFLVATRIAAYALVPLGLVMTGVVEWLADTAISLTAWAGFGVLGLSWVLFMVTRAVEHRRGGTRRERRENRQQRRAADASARPGTVVSTDSPPSLTPDSRQAGRRSTAVPRGDDDFSDIEAILKKHGI